MKDNIHFRLVDGIPIKDALKLDGNWIVHKLTLNPHPYPQSLLEYVGDIDELLYFDKEEDFFDEISKPENEDILFYNISKLVGDGSPDGHVLRPLTKKLFDMGEKYVIVGWKTD